MDTYRWVESCGDTFFFAFSLLLHFRRVTRLLIMIACRVVWRMMWVIATMLVASIIIDQGPSSAAVLSTPPPRSAMKFALIFICHSQLSASSPDAISAPSFLLFSNIRLRFGSCCCQRRSLYFIKLLHFIGPDRSNTFFHIKVVLNE